MSEQPKDPLADLYQRPGFKIRRCHQFALSIFMDTCKEFELTPTQYGLLSVIARVPRIEQITAARLMGLDRSTCAMVAARLEERGMIRRELSPVDRRRRQLELTPEGREFLDRATPAAAAAQRQLMAPLSDEERVVFMHCLDKLLGAFNENSRVPIKAAEPG